MDDAAVTKETLGMSTPAAGSALAQPVMIFDVHDRASGLRELPAYAEGKPSGATLVKEEDLRIVLIALRSGGRMEQHSASGLISIQVLDGAVSVSLPQRNETLTVGSMLVLEAGIPHDVAAESDSLLLLTIGRTKYTVPQGNKHVEA